MLIGYVDELSLTLCSMELMKTWSKQFSFIPLSVWMALILIWLLAIL